MSFAIDTNVLLYASDESSQHHASAADFLRRCVEGSELFCLGWPTILAYLRIATHPAIFRRPMRHDEAVGNIQALLDLPHVRALPESDAFWSHYLELADETPVRGNLVPDVHLAAILRSHGIKTLYTRDRDFLKFGFLDVRDPIVLG